MNRREPTLATVEPASASRPARAPKPAIALDRMGYRIADLAQVLGVSRRTIERQRSAGRFPPPDFSIGKAPLWKPETMRRWIDAGGHL